MYAAYVGTLDDFYRTAALQSLHEAAVAAAAAWQLQDLGWDLDTMDNTVVSVVPAALQAIEASITPQVC